MRITDVAPGASRYMEQAKANTSMVRPLMDGKSIATDDGVIQTKGTPPKPDQKKIENVNSNGIGVDLSNYGPKARTLTPPGRTFEAKA